MENSDMDGLRNAPWYISFLIRVGVPTSFASVLLWFLLTNVTGALNYHGEILQMLASTDQTVVRNQETITKMLSEQSRTTEATIRFLSVMCYNSAQTDVERERCSNAITTSEYSSGR